MPDLLQWLSATVMSKETCAVLTAVFPIVLLTAVLERRAIHLNIRRKGWFRWTTQAIVSACSIGLGLFHHPDDGHFVPDRLPEPTLVTVRMDGFGPASDLAD